ncbi:hypothetical protein QR680_011933 [Steinernema hermaphroditum]|uniref:Senescence domain-containing protein n=1 Tax=Steinernema hermaphroditum TaxID=289476 RepID=A0AA39I2K4_9BILA|nr:hypothetical protein QR680_011933 [Steinernema hermaphroditum]
MPQNIIYTKEFVGDQGTVTNIVFEESTDDSRTTGLGGWLASAASVGRSLTDVVADTSLKVGRKVYKTTYVLSETASELGTMAKESLVDVVGGAAESAGSAAKNVAMATKGGAEKAYVTTLKFGSGIKSTADRTMDNSADYASEAIENATMMASKAAGALRAVPKGFSMILREEEGIEEAKEALEDDDTTDYDSTASEVEYEEKKGTSKARGL